MIVYIYYTHNQRPTPRPFVAVAAETNEGAEQVYGTIYGVNEKELGDAGRFLDEYRTVAGTARFYDVPESAVAAMKSRSDAERAAMHFRTPVADLI